MPKIKLKPSLNGMEVGIGNLVHLKISAGETVEVAENALAALLTLGHFDQVHEDAKSEAGLKEQKSDSNDES